MKVKEFVIGCLPSIVLASGLAYSMVGAMWSFERMVDLRQAAIAKADLNEDKTIGPEEAILVYESLGYTGQQYFNKITQYRKHKFLQKNATEYYVKYSRWGLAPYEQDILDATFDKFADSNRDGIISEEEGKSIYLRVYGADPNGKGCPSTYKVNLRLGEYSDSRLRDVRDTIVTPWRVGEGSELERYVKGDVNE